MFCNCDVIVVLIAVAVVVGGGGQSNTSQDHLIRCESSSLVKATGGNHSSERYAKGFGAVDGTSMDQVGEA